MIKKSIFDFHDMKKNSKKVAWMTAYDFPLASLAKKAGIDMILVGDSLGMVVYGYDGTIPVTRDECVTHCKAVRRGALSTFIVGDMPFGSYQNSDSNAVENAIRFIKEALAVREAGVRFLLVEAISPELAKAITKLLDIPVYGIGAGVETDGQILICGDMLGYFEAFTPKFVKKYADVAKVITDAIKNYIT